jgi:hypothetical protein
MERKIGVAGTSSHSIPGSRIGGILSDLQLDTVQNAIDPGVLTRDAVITEPAQSLGSNPKAEVQILHYNRGGGQAVCSGV